MDYVYICRPGENEELRYSIRSVIKNAKHDNIWVVGYKPDWYCGNFFSVPNIGSKFRNIRNCITTIPKIDEISEDFVMIEDDMFIVKQIQEMPIFHGGILKDRVNQLHSIDPESRYVQLLSLTDSYIKKHRVKEPINYDIHVPLVMNKKKIEKTINNRSSAFPRSTYGNLNHIGGEYTDDVKVHLSGTWVAKSYDFESLRLPFISTDEHDSFEEVYEKVLKDMFPEPSPYER